MRRIIFFCGDTAEQWAPPKLLTTGIGGSETAVVEIAKRFAADGWHVDVFGDPGQWEGVHDGVGYWEYRRLPPNTRCDVLVSWRQPGAHVLPVEAACRILWCHDHNNGPDAGPAMAKWDKVLGVSAYHRDFLAKAYGLSNVDYVRNGIDLKRFDPTIKKIPFRCVYASSPDRGLMALLKMWPNLIGKEKSAELHVCYGFDSMDPWINAGNYGLATFKAACLDLMGRTKGVVNRGRLPQDELAKLYSESVAVLYPSDFLETSCISMMEAMAGGCVPVCSSAGALKETVGDGGIIVWGPNGTRSNPYSPAWRDFFVHTARAVLFERNVRLIAEAKARERAKIFTWDASYLQWRWLVDRLLEPAETASMLKAAG